MLTPILVLLIVWMAYLWLRTRRLLGACRCELELSRIREEASDEVSRQVDREFMEYRRKHLENMVRGLKVRLPWENVTNAELIHLGLIDEETANLVANAPDGKWIEVPAEETEGSD